MRRVIQTICDSGEGHILLQCMFAGSRKSMKLLAPAVEPVLKRYGSIDSIA